MDFRTIGVAELAEAVRAGEVRAVEIATDALERITALNPALNAFVEVDADAALATARDLDARRSRGEDLGPLAGVPLGVKDLEDASGYRTTQGSRLFADHPPVTRDSVLVSRLKDAGCVVVGKTNTPELGWQPQTDNEVFGPTRSPWNREHTPGGSSGGSAAAIASGMVALATGSDGGGSIRIPAALCGFSGFKPSLGRVPSGGSEPPHWPDLSTSAPMARTTFDIAYALDAVIGPDPTDLRSLPMPEASWAAAVEDPRVPMRVAWSPTLGYAAVDREVRAVCERAVKVLADLGAEIEEVDSVFSTDPITPWLTMANAFMLRSLRHAWGTGDWGKLTPGLAHQLESAAATSAVDLVEAMDACHRMNLALIELFHHVRLLVTPTTAASAPRCGEPGRINGTPTYAWVGFTYPFNLTRSPAGTVCAGLTSSGLPVGLQLVGPQHADAAVLRAMAALEAALGEDTVASVD